MISMNTSKRRRDRKESSASVIIGSSVAIKQFNVQGGGGQFSAQGFVVEGMSPASVERASIPMIAMEQSSFFIP